MMYLKDHNDKYYSFGHSIKGKYLKVDIAITIYKKGSVHYGYWRNDKKHYYGRYISENGDLYDSSAAKDRIAVYSAILGALSFKSTF